MYTPLRTRWLRLTQMISGIFVTALLAILVWTYCRNAHIRTIRWYDTEAGSCPDSFLALNSDELAQARRLLHVVLRTLQKHGVQAALCHGSLWGVLRRGDLLPCDPQPDLCLLDSELLKAAPHLASTNEIFKSLHAAEFSVSEFDNWMGLHRLKFTLATREIQINLRLFRDCTNFYYWSHRHQYANDYPSYLPQPEPPRPRWACPAALSFYVFNWAEDAYQGFPKFLLEPPFRNLTLVNYSVSVPNDDFEMQKYVYPSDWWKEKSSVCCMQ
ncbi:hypothetical protein PoB_004480100 [Plakobranchus ocellatus]|uniref:LicD family protein n=1 Tax=Plakobranchus ocellatus TaxID=259542 RepID=A0AAV4B4M9_9GAST|nr:hypothetical protein PoB_004480100 [Plakobranchus ocellatus]